MAKSVRMSVCKCILLQGSELSGKFAKANVTQSVVSRIS